VEGSSEQKAYPFISKHANKNGKINKISNLQNKEDHVPNLLKAFFSLSPNKILPKRISFNITMDRLTLLWNKPL
jgi:hypothetical protein